MNRQWIWFLILGATLLSSGWFVSKAGYQVVSYLRMSRSISAQAVNIQSERIGEDTYLLRGAYRYSVGGKEYRGEGRMPGRLYRNAQSAEMGIKELEGRALQVWFAPGSPGRSQIEKRFPVKGSVYSLILVGILIYLWRLSLYAKQAAVQ